MKLILPTFRLFILLLLSPLFFSACGKSNSGPLAQKLYVVTTLAGSGIAGSADGIGKAASFNGPGGIAVAKNGNVYVADYFNNKIRVISPKGVVTTLAGNAQNNPGYMDTGAYAGFDNPFGITLDLNDNLVVTDQTNSEIRKVTPTGVITTVAGTWGRPYSVDGTGAAANFSYPAGIASDGRGNFYEVDYGYGKIRKISAGWVVTTIAGGNYFYANGTGTAAGFNGSVGIAVDSKGNIYVADAGYNQIRKITPGAVVTTFAGNNDVRGGFGNGSASGGQSGYADGTGTAALFNRPTGIAIDSKDYLYVTDEGNNLIRKITPDGIVTTIAGNPHVAAGNSDGIDSLARFNNPSFIAVDQYDNLYVSDQFNNMIRKITRQ